MIDTSKMEDAVEALNEEWLSVVRAHMQVQPFSIVCTCGGVLYVIDCFVDSDMDLNLRVSPCAACAAKETP